MGILNRILGRLSAPDPDLVEEVRGLRGEVRRLEGLLDVGLELDGNLRGNDNPRFFRPLLAAGLRRTEDIRDFDEVNRHKILKVSHTAYALQGAAENLVDTHLDFMIGDGLQPKVKTAAEPRATELQAVLDEIWKDPRSGLDRYHEDWTRSLLIEGELVLAAELSETDGHIELAWIDPLRVTTVSKDARNRDAYVWLDGSSTEAGSKRLFVLDSLTSQISIARGAPREDGTVPYTVTEEANGRSTSVVVDGLCFTEFWNRPTGALRGRGELTSVLDQVDAYDEMVWATIDVQNIKRLFMIHVQSDTVKSAADGKRLLEDLGLKAPPRAPRTYCTNKNVDIEFKQPQHAESERWLAEELGVSIYGSKGFPESWRGRQSDLASGAAKSSELLPLRRLRRKQRRVLGMFHRMVDVQLELRRRRGADLPELEWDFVVLEVGGRDKSRIAETLKSVSAALVQASSIGAIKPELAHALFVACVDELGESLPPDVLGVPELPGAPGEGGGDFEAMLRQLLSRRGRTGEAADEEDRDRSEEAAS